MAANLNARLIQWLAAEEPTGSFKLVWQEPTPAQCEDTEPPGDSYDPVYGVYATFNGNDYLIWHNPQAKNPAWAFALTPITSKASKEKS